ncbi:MAG: hypothetical protein K2M43_00385 [Mycoplasmoidaceae bacterium]|nr:hypothetical protein [Mycoplasmoidaceae bacterium]
MTSIYYSNKVLSDNTPISFYKNDTELDNGQAFKDTIYNAYRASKDRSSAFGNYEYSADSLSYEQTMASLYYLTKDNNKNLINYLRTRVVTINTSAFVV